MFRRLGRNQEQQLKSIMVALGFGVVAALFVYFASVETQAAKAIQTFAGNFLDTGAAFFAGVGLGRFFETLSGLFLGSWVPITAAVCVSIVAFLVLQIPLGARPVIDRIWALPPAVIDTDIRPAGKDPISAVGSLNEMIGRKEQLRSLSRLSSRPDRQSYAVVEGPEGVGKSRLAVEWLRELYLKGWDVGFLLSGIGPQDLRQSHFRKPTAIVIDDANSVSDLWTIVFELLSRNQKIRVLLVDQFVQSPSDSLSTQTTALLQARQTLTLRLMRMRSEEMSKIAPQLSLPLLERSEGKPLFALLGGDPTAEIRRRAERRLKLAGTPDKRRLLLLAAFVAPIEQSDREQFEGTKATLSEMRVLLEGESKTVLRKMIPPIKPDILADEIAIKILEEMNEAELESFLRKAANINALAAQRRIGSLWTRQYQDQDRILIREKAQSLIDSEDPNLRIAVIEIGRHFAAVAVGDDTPMDEVANALAIVRQMARNRPFDLEMRDICVSCHGHILRRYAGTGRKSDFYYVVESIAVLFEEKFGIPDESNLFLELAFVSSALQCLRLVEHPIAMAKLSAWFMRIIPVDLRVISIELACFVMNAICVFLIESAKKGDDVMMDRWKELLQILSERPDGVGNYDLRVEEASAASVIILFYQQQHRPDKILPWLARISEINRNPNFARDRMFIECELTAITNVIIAFGSRGDFANVEFWGARLFEKYEAFRSDQALWLPTYLVDGPANVIGSYAVAGRLQDVERWAAKALAVIIQFHIGTLPVGMAAAQIRLCRNAILAYEKTTRSDRVEFWGELIAPLIEQPEVWKDVVVRRLEAIAVMGIMNHYSETRSYPEFRKWGERFISLSSEALFKNDAELWETITEAAYLGLTVALTYSDRNWQERWRMVVVESAARFTYHPQIQHYAGRLGLSNAFQAAFQQTIPAKPR